MQYKLEFHTLIFCSFALISLASCSSLSLDEKVCLTDDGVKVTCPQQLTAASNVNKADANNAPKNMPYFAKSPNYLVLGDYAENLAEALGDQLGSKRKNLHLAVTPFTWFDASLQNTGPLGLQFAELLLNRLSQQRVDVIDTLVTGEYAVTSSGLRVFSRTEHNEKIIAAAQHALVGTMLPSDDGIVVNARIVDVNSGRVQATHSFILPKILFR